MFLYLYSAINKVWHDACMTQSILLCCLKLFTPSLFSLSISLSHSVSTHLIDLTCPHSLPTGHPIVGLVLYSNDINSFVTRRNQLSRWMIAAPFASPDEESASLFKFHFRLMEKGTAAATFVNLGWKCHLQYSFFCLIRFNSYPPWTSAWHLTPIVSINHQSCESQGLKVSSVFFRNIFSHVFYLTTFDK